MPPRETVFQWHHYTFEVPAGGAELARSETSTQAFRLARTAWGIQFHAEVTLPMLSAWVEEDAGELPVPGPELLAESRERITASNELGRALCAAFLRAARS
jgi:GMP synthase (glutamine-hydrolysing)